MVPNGGEFDEGVRDESITSDDRVAPDAALLRIDPSVLELDRVFSVLSHPKRRYLVYALAEDSEWTLPELATKLAAWEGHADERDVGARTRDRQYISLYHTHVPNLVDHGVAEFDAETETLARGAHAERVFAALAGAGDGLDLAQERHAGRTYDGDAGADSV
ncbi:hypothetical protein U4E84_11025 [Halorubrum sp. AD140]|uniref:DUF7344 domain-containing protein n=1 Tax=Halorubrum sp. AD140 TaxID=3050073 RepID=UPI002ACCF6BB|nr:hypothetical protein [Halorubrum sp. AD140]MDZ5811873.1 hypothetical protein [Halorubrum sp. AD140]